jgi:hypothetical protein
LASRLAGRDEREQPLCSSFNHKRSQAMASV